MKRAYYLPAMAAGLLIISASCHKKDTKESGPDATLPVEVSNVVTDSVTVFKEYPGSLIADRSADVMCRVNGYVSGKHYTAGEFVKEGQLLFTVASSSYKNAVDEAEAALATAKSENEYAEQHYTAVAKAYESNAVSKMEVAEALSNRDQSRSAIKSAEARLADARTTLGYCTITAPMSGHITMNEFSAGAYVSGEGSPVALAKVYDDANVIANFAIEDASFLRMFENPNNRHLIDYKAIPIYFSEKLPHDYTANLDYMAPNVDASTGTIKLQAVIDNKYNELRAGMYCTIKMPYKVDPRAILIRDASISTDQLGKYVYVVNDSNKVVYTPIKVGDLANDSMRIVTSGLKPTDRYVTAAMLKVRDGMTVKPIAK